MSIAEFVSQGGYGYYVWSSYGLCLLLLLVEIVQLHRHQRTILFKIGRLMRMRAAERDSMENK